MIQKGLPLAYGTDLQEDKELVFDAADTAISCARAFARLVQALEPKPERMREAAEDGCLWAADAAEFLVLRGVPFRTAYAAGRKLVEARAAAAGPPSSAARPRSARSSPISAPRASPPSIRPGRASIRASSPATSRSMPASRAATSSADPRRSVSARRSGGCASSPRPSGRPWNSPPELRAGRNGRLPGRPLFSTE